MLSNYLHFFFPKSMFKTINPQLSLMTKLACDYTFVVRDPGKA